MAEKVLQSELRVSAVNATGRVFEQIAAKVKGLEGTMKSLKGVTAGFGGVVKTFDRLHHMTRMMAPVAGPAGAYESSRAASAIARGSVAAVADAQHELARMRAAGMLEPEIKEAEEVAQRFSTKYKPISQTAIMHALRNARSIVGTFEEASQIIDPLLKLRVIAMGAAPGRMEEFEEEFDNILKGTEIKGITQDAPRFANAMELISRALNVFGDTIKINDFYETIKYGRQASQSLSDEFMLATTGPTFAQEMKGSSAGKAMSAAFQAIIGGQMKQPAIQLLEKFGLLDPKKVVKTKTGATKGFLPGGVIGSEIFKKDPYQWVQEVFLPALAKKGVTSEGKIQDLIAVMFKAGVAGQFMSVLATQQTRFEKDRKLVHDNPGLKSADIFLNQDPFIVWQGVENQFTNLLKAAASPLAQPAIAAMKGLAEGISALTKAAGDHPIAAVTGLLGSTALAGGAAVAASSWTIGRMGALLRGGAGAAGGVATEEAAITLAWMKSIGAAAPAAGGGWLRTVAGRAALPLTLFSAAQFLHDENAKWAGTTLNERARLARGGGSLRDVYRADFQADRERLGIAKLDGDATVTVKIEGPEWLRSAVSIASDIAGLKIGTSGDTGRSMPEVAPVKYLR